MNGVKSILSDLAEQNEALFINHGPDLTDSLSTYDIHKFHGELETAAKANYSVRKVCIQLSSNNGMQDDTLLWLYTEFGLAFKHLRKMESLQFVVPNRTGYVALQLLLFQLKELKELTISVGAREVPTNLDSSLPHSLEKVALNYQVSRSVEKVNNPFPRCLSNLKNLSKQIATI